MLNRLATARVTTMSAARSLRAVKSAPNLRRAIRTTAPSPNPTPLFNASQYTSLSVNSLKAECKKKGLKSSGRKGELIDRLSSFDASRSSNTGLEARLMTTASRVKEAIPPVPKLNKSFATAATIEPNWRDTVDRIRFPFTTQPGASTNLPSIKIPIPPDSWHVRGGAKEGTAEYTTPLPDDGVSHGLESTVEGVHVLGDQPVRSVEDSTPVERLSGDENNSYNGSEYQYEEFKPKDKKFLRRFALGVAAWWAIGSVGKVNIGYIDD